MASLAEIRARLQAAENKQGGQSTGGDNSIYPHWNMEEGQSATVRFLPDGNSKNTFFWIERAMIRLPFAGVKGEMDKPPHDDAINYNAAITSSFYESELDRMKKLALGK